MTLEIGFRQAQLSTMQRSLLLLLTIGLFAVTPADRLRAQAANTFELGGQILGFLHPDEMHLASMTWLKMQIAYRRGGTTQDAQNVINHARRHGFKVLLSIIGVKSELAADPARYYQDYAQFVAAVAALNPDGIEVWNEPNIDQEWPAGLISGSNYTQMLRRAYPAIKQANPNVLVISGAPAPTGYFGGGCAANGCDDKIFIEQMAAAGAASYFDCTGIHYNEGVLPPTASSGDPRGNSSHYTRYYPTMVSTYRTVFPNKPLCFTELGYLSPDGLGSLPPGAEWAANTSAQEQAQWLAQAATISRDSGIVRLMIVWNVDAPFTPANPMAGWAIIRADNQCLPCATLRNAMIEDTQPPAVPALLSPQNGHSTAQTRPTLSWQAVTDAVRYEINLHSVSPAWTLAASGSAARYTPADPLFIGVYTWQVRAIDAAGNASAWSSPFSFTVVSADDSAPALNHYTSRAVTLSWNRLLWAAEYEVEIGKTAGFTGSLEWEARVPANTLQATTPALPNGVYYWRVRGRTAGGGWGAWSAAQPFTVRAG